MKQCVFPLVKISSFHFTFTFKPNQHLITKYCENGVIAGVTENLKCINGLKVVCNASTIPLVYTQTLSNYIYEDECKGNFTELVRISPDVCFGSYMYTVNGSDKIYHNCTANCTQCGSTIIPLTRALLPMV